MRSLLFAFFLFLSFVTGAQVVHRSTDTVYSIRFVSGTDSLPLVSADVYLYGVSYWQTNAEGLVNIKQSGIRGKKDGLYFELRKQGFSSLRFGFSELKAGATVTLYVALAPPIMLDEISIVAYMVPMIEKEPSRREKRKSKGATATFAPDTITYTPAELARYDSLVKGIWKIPQQLRNTAILSPGEGNFSIQKIGLNYPVAARDHSIEEKIYMGFEIDKNGYIQNIKLLRGKHPVLALEAARALAGLPRFEPYNSTASQKFTIPVHFDLKD